METYFDRRSGSLAVALHPEIADEGKYAHSTLNDLHAPKGHSPEAVKSWLSRAVEYFNIKPTSWAKAAGLAPSTINRFLTSDEKGRNLSASTIDKLSSALIDLVMQTASSHWSVQRNKSENIFKLSSVLIDAPLIGIISENATLKGDDTDLELRTASWRDRHVKTLTVPVPTPWLATKMVAFEVDGSSYDPIYPDGSILICIPIFSLDAPPGPGSKVIVYEKSDKGYFKTYLREVKLDPNGRSWFMPLKGTESDNLPGLFLHPPQRDPVVKATFRVFSSYRLEPEMFGAQKRA